MSPAFATIETRSCGSRCGPESHAHSRQIEARRSPSFGGHHRRRVWMLTTRGGSSRRPNARCRFSCYRFRGVLPRFGTLTWSKRSWTSVAGTRYRIVVSSDLCPIQCCTVRTSSPERNIRVAYVDRKVFRSNSIAIPARCATSLQRSSMSCLRFPLGDGKRNGLDAVLRVALEQIHQFNQYWNLPFLPSLRVKSGSRDLTEECNSASASAAFPSSTTIRVRRPWIGDEARQERKRVWTLFGPYALDRMGPNGTGPPRKSIRYDTWGRFKTPKTSLRC
jgi:hypothetical protein